MKAEKTAQVAPNQGGAGNHDGGRDTRGISRIVWLEDGPHRVERETEAEYAVIVKAAPEKATADEVMEWRIRP